MTDQLDRYRSMYSMLQRVVNELRNPPCDSWGCGGWKDEELLADLCIDVEKLLEEIDD
jgi:hypothetical protein